MIEKQHQLMRSWVFALSMAFKCTLMAPHGGIFVFPVVGHALMYIVALLIGAIVGAIMLGLLRKPVESK